MRARERVMAALDHRQPDRVPLDLGSTNVTGITASSLYKLRAALGLEERQVKVFEPYQMLGLVEEDVIEALGIDVLGLRDDGTFYGFPATDWKPWRLFDGTPVLVPGLYNTEPAADGYLYQYPQGDRMASPSARMPVDGYYHDSIERQLDFKPEELDPQAWVDEMYALYTEDELRLLEERSRALYEGTDKAIIGNWGQGSFGDIAYVPAPHVKQPHGIRKVADWYMASLLYPDYVQEIYALQREICLKNLEMYHQAVGERICAVFVSGTDFGTQNGPFISPRAYRKLYQPNHKAINDWIHAHTTWKTFFHTCGSMVKLYDDLIDAGVDIVNPVQIAAEGMDPTALKERWGDKLVFWGGGIDTQWVLPFGTPEEIREHVRQQIEILSPGGGFIFDAVHNIQSGIPTENLVALFDAVREYGAL